MSGESSIRSRVRSVVSLAAYFVIYTILVLPISAYGADLLDNEAIPNIVVTDKYLVAPDELLSSKIPLPASDVPLSVERLNSDVIERSGFRALGPLL